MASTSSSGAIGRTHVSIPSSISYREEVDPIEQKVSRCAQFFRSPLQKIGAILRNAFFLPLYKKNISLEIKLNQQLARDVVQTLKTPKTVCSEELNLVRQCFSIRDVTLHLEGSTGLRVFTVRLFESKMPINGKKLRIILFSFNGNTEAVKGGATRRWEPLTLRALSENPLCILKAFHAFGIRVDSLAATSLGTVALEGLKYLSTKLADRAAIPTTLVVNRGLASVEKVAHQLYPFPLSYLLHAAAKFSGWDANPEHALLNFLEQGGEEEKQRRKVIIIEALNDCYFSGAGSFESNIHTRIEKLGIPVFRASFYPFPFQVRAHHALSLDHLVHNSATKVLSNTVPLSLGMYAKMSSILAKDIFYKGNGTEHTCFYICGRDDTLDVGAVREIIPLLSAFIETGQEMEQNNNGEADKKTA